MSFLKAIFFTLPLMVIASIGLTYLVYTQAIEPRFNDVIMKMEAATTQMEQSTEELNQISAKIDTLLARP